MHGGRYCYLRAAAGLSAKRLIPACGIHVMVTVSLELEQHHVGQPVGGVPAVLKAHRFRLAILVLSAFKLYGEPNDTAATDKPRREGGGRLLKKLACVSAHV